MVGEVVSKCGTLETQQIYWEWKKRKPSTNPQTQPTEVFWLELCNDPDCKLGYFTCLGVQGGPLQSL